MGKVPVKRAPVKEPKNWTVPGAKVPITAPRLSGTTTMPPGMRSMARLIGSCMLSPFLRCVNLARQAIGDQIGAKSTALGAHQILLALMHVGHGGASLH